MSYSVTEKIALVRAARGVFGTSAAEKVWRDLGLPEIPGLPKKGDVASYVEEGLRRVPGARVTARDIYRSYLVWAAARGLVPLSENTFGRELPLHGVVKHKGRIRKYIDVEIREEFQPYKL